MSSHYATNKLGEFIPKRKHFDLLKMIGAECFYGAKPDIYLSFPENNGVVSCIDEGTPHGHIRFAGSGILNDDILVLMENLLRDGKLWCITSHDECSAAKLFAQIHDLKLSEADAYAGELLENVARQLKVGYKHIPIGEMKRPPDLHTARIIYYAGTDAFDPTKAIDMPNGFVISRAHMDAENAQKEAGIAADIAFGDHGFGDLFTGDTPLHIVAIGKPNSQEFSAKNLTGELKPIKSKYGDRVIIDGFTAPLAPL